MKDHQKVMEEFDIMLDSEITNAQGANNVDAMPSTSPLYQDYKDHKQMVAAIRREGRNELLQAMKEWDSEMGELPKARMRAIRPVWYYAAASVAVLFAFSWLWIGYSESTNLVARHYQPYSYVSENTRGDEGTALESEIEQAYSHGDYLGVIEQVNSAELATRTMQIDFLYANACQATGEVSQAIPVFEKIAETDSPYRAAAQWYLALCQLSEKDTEKAISQLKVVQASKSSYSQKAAELLADLEK